MRPLKIFLWIGVTVMGMALICWMVTRSAALQETGRPHPELSLAPNIAAPPTPPAHDLLPATEASSGELARNASNAMSMGQMKSIAETNMVLAPVSTKKPKEPLRDPLARAAMGLVGVDPEAEAYWLEAIFDRSLPQNEREDLMEDLNEEGLSDKKHPGPQDLPVILNRIAIIGEILPHADEFMVAHLGEAYNDLVNLAEITQGGGAPVR